MLQATLGAVVSFALVLTMALVFVRGTRRLWASAPVLAPAIAVVGIGLVCWVQFLISWASPTLGGFAAFAIVLAVVAAAGALRVWTLLRDHPLLPLVAAGVLASYLGLCFLWTAPEADLFGIAALRFGFSTTPYPVDNMLPMLMAHAIAAGSGTHELFMSWNGSDRPPLQSGFLILVESVFSGLGLRGGVLAFSAGIVLQLVWIPAVWSLLRILGAGARTSALAVAFTAATGTVLVNTVYAWPKLLSAALVISAFALLVGVIRLRLRLGVALSTAALATSLAMLSHGAAAFAVPAVLVLAIVAMRRNPGWLRSGLVSAGVVLASYLPWIAYQRFADPPGDRLLKWHLAGVIPLDERSFLEVFVDAYRQTTPGELLDSKLHNLAVVLSPVLAGSPFANPSVVLDATILDSALASRRFDEYYSTLAALGVSAVLLLVIIVMVLVAVIRRRPVPDRRILAVMALMVPCVLLWCVLMFIPGGAVVHQGSHVWILVLIALSFAWIARRAPRLALPVLLVQLVATAVVYTPFFGHPQLRAGALVLVFGGLALAATGLVLDYRATRAVSGEGADEHRAPSDTRAA